MLTDGTPVHIRQIQPSDALVAFHGRLSNRTTWLRFFSVHPYLSPREVEDRVGGVTLDLRNAPELRSAWSAMSSLLERGRGIVQRMAPAGVETIGGVTVDSTFGPLVLFGVGGTTTELFEDRAVRLVPLTGAGAREMVRSLRTSPLLFGYRGREPVDEGALESVLLRLAALADAFPEVAELDLNPIVASPSGAVVVDARIRVSPCQRRPGDTRQLAEPRPFGPTDQTSEVA